MKITHNGIRFSMTRPQFFDLGVVSYQDSYKKMLDIVTQPSATMSKTDSSDCSSVNQFWFLEHPPVFTQGIRSHGDDNLTNIRDIPLVKTDRGGLITYHGPGQLTIYALCHLDSKNVRRFVQFLEQVVIDTLVKFDIDGQRREGMPGVYVSQDKIASIGLRIKNGISYHGISLNVNMDLTPFSYIDPCGYQGLQMTQMSDFISSITLDEVIKVAKESIMSRIDSPS